jgi:hypothetical protein
MKTFTDIELNDEVRFQDNGLTYTGIVVDVKLTTFTIRCLMCHTNSNGHKSFYNALFNFMKKSGKKASHRNTYGNALSYNKPLEYYINKGV